MKFRMWARAKNVPKGSRCAYCGGWAQIIEHLLPSLKPGDFRWNEVFACIPCNGIKMDFQKRHVDLEKTKALIQIEPHVESVFFRVPKCWEEVGNDYDFWDGRNGWCKRELQNMFSVDWQVQSVIDALFPRKNHSPIKAAELIKQCNSSEVMAAESEFEKRLEPVRLRSVALGFGRDLQQWESLAGDICLGLYEADAKNRAYFERQEFRPMFAAGKGGK